MVLCGVLYVSLKTARTVTSTVKCSGPSDHRDDWAGDDDDDDDDDAAPGFRTVTYCGPPFGFHRSLVSNTFDSVQHPPSANFVQTFVQTSSFLHGNRTPAASLLNPRLVLQRRAPCCDHACYIAPNGVQ